MMMMIDRYSKVHYEYSLSHIDIYTHKRIHTYIHTHTHTHTYIYIYIYIYIYMCVCVCVCVCVYVCAFLQIEREHKYLSLHLNNARYECVFHAFKQTKNSKQKCIRSDWLAACFHLCTVEYGVVFGVLEANF